MSQFKNAKHIHFLGIGGIGVSALARMAMHQGKEVSGSDRSLSRITKELARMGARIHEGHDPAHVSAAADLVVYSPAITDENPELVRARALRIPTLTYPQALGDASQGAFTIAVSGTHGKTTTTAMIADVLRDHINPTVIVGSLLSGGRSNFVPGDTRRFLVEACEYKRSFLGLHPNILVITNIDLDHLDYYKDIHDIISAFRELVQKVPETGAIVCDLDDAKTREALRGAKARIINYRAFLNPSRKLSVIGDHNQLNAAVAHAVAEFFDVPEKDIDATLAQFAGTWRRSERKGKTAKGAEVFDDYGHHPTEIQTTLSGFRKRFPEKKLTVIFQPHLYSRTRLLFNDFVESFDRAHRVLVAPIYAAREEDDGSISHHELARALRARGVAAESYNDTASITDAINGTPGDDTIVLTLGAGDIYEVGENLLS